MQTRRTGKAVGGLQVIRLPNGDFQEVFLNIPAIGFEDPTSLFQRLYDYLADHPRLRIVRQDVFGVVNDPVHVKHTKAYRLNGVEWPVTWVEEGNGGGCPVAGIQVHAVSGVTVQPVQVDGRTIGTAFENAAARYCVLGGIRSENAEEPRGEQAWETLEIMEQALGLVGLDFSHVCRTWFYLDDILEWYDEFNRVRNEFFRERGVFDRLVPASTGVGGGNSAGTAVVADLLAIQPKHPAVRLRMVPSPLQCPALEYGSSFSRAVEFIMPRQRRLYVSGTASIAPDGRTLHVGDVAKQVKLTMEVVAGILNSCQMGWEHITRAIAYFKHAEDAPVFSQYCAQQRLPNLPVIVAKNDVCRDDLLFEIEVDAACLE
ncbi:MAG: translation initiation inhibitor [Verrucomicrobia bacterium]|nr:translation initiation inhibitor [Verrucomicrobiota bacterium]